MLLDTQALQEGLVVTIVGMGVVFSFLITLIISMNVMSVCVRALNKIFPEAVETVPVKSKTSVSSDDEVAVAIAVACIKNGF